MSKKCIPGSAAPILARSLLLLAWFLSSVGLSGCGTGSEERRAVVTATAYTLREAETKSGNEGLAAWGDRLKPGMKAIAVSRDLIPRGLDHGTRVEIEGLDGVYIVRDKMNRRWRNKIDIFMGRDVAGAREFGKQTLTISWEVKAE